MFWKFHAIWKKEQNNFHSNFKGLCRHDQMAVHGIINSHTVPASVLYYICGMHARMQQLD